MYAVTRLPVIMVTGLYFGLSLKQIFSKAVLSR